MISQEEENPSKVAPPIDAQFHILDITEFVRCRKHFASVAWQIKLASSLLTIEAILSVVKLDAPAFIYKTGLLGLALILMHYIQRGSRIANSALLFVIVFCAGAMISQGPRPHHILDIKSAFILGLNCLIPMWVAYFPIKATISTFRLRKVSPNISPHQTIASNVRITQKIRRGFRRIFIRRQWLAAVPLTCAAVCWCINFFALAYIYIVPRDTNALDLKPLLFWILVLTFWIASKFLFWTLRISVLRIPELEAIDTRSPIILLRSFKDDNLRIQTKHAWFNPTGKKGHTLEETIANELDAFGPLITLGMPGDQNPVFGAVRGQYSEDQWRATVTDFISRAPLIATIAGDTDALLWECSQIAKLRATDRTVFLFPPTSTSVAASRLTTLSSAIPEFSIDTSKLDLKGSNIIAARHTKEHGLLLLSCKSVDAVSYSWAITIALEGLGNLKGQAKTADCGNADLKQMVS